MRQSHNNEPGFDFKKIGLKMKELRDSQGITQIDIANDLGTTVAYISNVENARTKLNLKFLTYYSALCHVPVEAILDAGREHPEGNGDEMSTEFGIQRALNFYNQEEKQKILKMLLAYKDLEEIPDDL